MTRMVMEIFLGKSLKTHLIVMDRQKVSVHISFIKKTKQTNKQKKPTLKYLLVVKKVSHSFIIRCAFKVA